MRRDVAALRVLHEVITERYRQDGLKAAGKFKSTCADPISNDDRFKILMEETGEVARVMCEGIDDPLDLAHLREELIQVAAVAVAWVEGLDCDVLREQEGGESSLPRTVSGNTVE